jgi:hypothetical protein
MQKHGRLEEQLTTFLASSPRELVRWQSNYANT